MNESYDSNYKDRPLELSIYVFFDLIVSKSLFCKLDMNLILNNQMVQNQRLKRKKTNVAVGLSAKTHVPAKKPRSRNSPPIRRFRNVCSPEAAESIPESRQTDFINPYRYE